MSFEVKRVGLIVTFIMLLMLVFVSAALAFAATPTTDPFYPAYNFVAVTVLGGALGKVLAICGIGYGVYQFVKHPELGMLGTLGAGIGIACLAMLPTITAALGMIV